VDQATPEGRAETDPRLDLPVFLFHGTDDANCPVQGVIDIGNRAGERGRMNIRALVVPDHDHSLEFLSSAVTGTLPEGPKILFGEVEKWAIDVHIPQCDAQEAQGADRHRLARQDVGPGSEGEGVLNQTVSAQRTISEQFGSEHQVTGRSSPKLTH